MNDIYDLLKINSEFFNDFSLLAKRVADHEVEKVINANVRKLKVIEERMYSDKQIKISRNSIQEVISRVKSAAKKDVGISWSIRDLRIIAYYLGLLQLDKKAYDYAIDLLEKNWRDLFINGLAFFILNTWNLLGQENRIKACLLLTSHLKEYNGNNKRYIQLKNHLNFFDENGPSRMAALLLQKKESIYNAPLTIGYKQSTFAMSYFSDVIVNYYKVEGLTSLFSIEEVLVKHPLDRTKKLVFANLVEKVDKFGSEVLQTEVSKLAGKVLGDITLSSSWTPYLGATKQEIEKLRNAKNLVNLWYARKIIEVFFEVCVQDPARKRFWLNYVEHVKDFRVAGSTQVKLNLQRDSRISEMISRYFIETASRQSQTAGLVLCMRDKVVIEFSDTGALYAYNHTNPKVSLARRKYIQAVEDLKNTSMSTLVEQTYYSYYVRGEGRMPHSGDWQHRMHSWLSRYVISSNEMCYTLNDERDNELFKEIILKEDDFYVFDEEEPVDAVHNKTTTKPQQRAISVASKNNNVVYEQKVPFLLNSKWLYNNKCKVIANDRGYFLYSGVSRHCVHLKYFDFGVSASGSIWIKSPTPSGWYHAVHSFDAKEKHIGYLRLVSGTVLFKQDLNSNEEIQIKL